MSDALPPLPPGFSLDTAADHPPLPPGFTLDAPAPMGADTVTTDALAKTIPLPNNMQALSDARAARTAHGRELIDHPLSALAGLGETAMTGIPGAPGDMETLGRLALSPFGVSRQTTLPTTESLATSAFGAPANDAEAQGRAFGGLLSPLVLGGGLKVTGKIVGPVASHFLGLTTGAGPRAIETAYGAGKEGGRAAQAFLENMRGNIPATDVVQAAKDAVAQMRSERSAAYQAGIGSTIQGDPAVLNFAPIDNAIRSVGGVGMYKGKSLSVGADKVWNAIENVVDDWRQSDPAQFHTAEGLDALKQKIGNLGYEEDLKAVAGPGTPGSVILNNVYNAIKGQIVNQAPGYARVMKDYSDATDEIRNIESALSLNPKANIDTSLRKLQSLMRDNVNTNYGARTAMGQTLVNNGATDLAPALAGQTLSSVTPRGIGRVLGSAEALASLHPAALPFTLPALAASSPRLAGEGAYAIGSLARNAGQALGTSGNTGVAAIAANPIIRAMLTQQLLSTLAQQATAVRASP